MTKIIPAALSLFLFPTTAEALSCEYGVTSFVPEDNAQDLPTNTSPVIWIADYVPTAEDIQLYNADSGEQIELNIRNISGKAYSIIPVSGFAAGTNYQFLSTQDSWTFSEFRIADQLDEEPPQQPIITNLERDSGEDEWGPWDYLSIQIDAPEDALYFQIEVADNADFIDSSIAIETAIGDQLWMGSGPCGGNLSQQDVENIRFIRITAYDIAGNASLVSDALEWDAPATTDDKIFGCSSIPASNIGLWSWVAVLGLAIRRRQ